MNNKVYNMNYMNYYQVMHIKVKSIVTQVLISATIIIIFIILIKVGLLHYLILLSIINLRSTVLTLINYISGERIV